MADDCRHRIQLGDCVFRILPASAGQPNWFYRKRRALLAHATQGDSGSHYALRVHPLQHDGVSHAASLESYRCRRLPHRSRLVRLRLQLIPYGKALGLPIFFLKMLVILPQVFGIKKNTASIRSRVFLFIECGQKMPTVSLMPLLSCSGEREPS